MRPGILIRLGFSRHGTLIGLGMSIAPVVLIAVPAELRAQDIPGIEICTAEKAMDRRTSCLQSNVDFLQKMINKLAADHQSKLDAANRQIEALKATVAGLQKVVTEMQVAHQKMADDLKTIEPAKGALAPAKEGAK
jgi:prophage DNA circulation protein